MVHVGVGQVVVVVMTMMMCVVVVVVMVVRQRRCQWETSASEWTKELSRQTNKQTHESASMRERMSEWVFETACDISHT